MITRAGDWWNYPVQHQTQSGCKSAGAMAEGEQLILYAVLAALSPSSYIKNLNNVIKWPQEEMGKFLLLTFVHVWI